jgi:predicted neutral ceramidase superfamily lipid hydrolase
VRTIAYEKGFLPLYVIFAYILAIVLTFILWKRNHSSKSAIFMAVVLLTIVGNVCATALMIQCISRYMIYNLPLFYMALLLEIKEIIGNKEK